MNNLLQRQERYCRDRLPVRLGGIAANLARVKSFGKNPDNSQLVASLLRESAWFIEWSAPETNLDLALDLAEIQRQILRWLADWSRLWPDEHHRQVVLSSATQWSQQILNQSGLLEES